MAVQFYQAITQSYKLRNVVHATTGGKATLCGRVVTKTNGQQYSSAMTGACTKCNVVIRARSRAHPGFEE